MWYLHLLKSIHAIGHFNFNFILRCLNIIEQAFNFKGGDPDCDEEKMLQSSRGQKNNSVEKKNFTLSLCTKTNSDSDGKFITPPWSYMVAPYNL